MLKFNLSLMIAALLVVSSVQLAAADKKKPSSNPSNQVSAQKSNGAAATPSNRNHTAGGKHIPETSQRAQKNNDKDLGCLVLPATCPTPPKH